MMTRTLGLGLVFAVVLGGLVVAQEAPARRTVTAEQVDKAVERAVANLFSRQNAEGGWGNYVSGTEVFQHGYDVCALMGLAYGGVSVNDPKLQKALDVVLKAELNKNYAYSVRVIALSQLYPRLPREQQELVKKRLMSDVEWLFKAQSDEGDWNYDGTGFGELSNTQMAILALAEASEVLRELPEAVWKKSLERYLKIQRQDGGWNYGHRSSIHASGQSYGSMTAAGVASLFVIRDKLYRGTGCPCRNGQSPRGGAEIDAAIDRGIDWLKKNFVVDVNPQRTAWYMYWPFSCERVGLASGIKYFGTHDWYREMAAHILAEQNADGSFGHISDTALAIAFLVKGRAPILVNKLQFAGPWNQHPRDVANLVKYVAHSKEQPFQWQVINLEVPVADMHDAPILYITAEDALELPDDQKQKLRQFTDTGGTILFEASCGNRQAILSWERLCKDLWPEWELQLVDRKHPLWSADMKLVGRLPALQGMSDGLRTFMFYSKADISCAWNTQAITRDKALFDMGANLYLYAIDRGKLRARLAGASTDDTGKYAEQKVSRGAKEKLTVARLKHGGEWHLGANYHPWQSLAAGLKTTAGIDLAVGEPVDLTAGDAPAAGEVSVLYMTGRVGCDLGAPAAEKLKAYLAGGGFLLADATMGDARFDEALRAMAAGAGLELKPLAADDPLVTGKFAAPAAGYDASKVDFTFALRSERVGNPRPALIGLYKDDKIMGLYSAFDLVFAQTGCKAFDSRGYAAQDARALLANLAIYLTTK